MTPQPEPSTLHYEPLPSRVGAVPRKAEASRITPSGGFAPVDVTRVLPETCPSSRGRGQVHHQEAHISAISRGLQARRQSSTLGVTLEQPPLNGHKNVKQLCPSSSSGASGARSPSPLPRTGAFEVFVRVCRRHSRRRHHVELPPRPVWPVWLDLYPRLELVVLPAAAAQLPSQVDIRHDGRFPLGQRAR